MYREIETLSETDNYQDVLDYFNREFLIGNQVEAIENLVIVMDRYRNDSVAFSEFTQNLRSHRLFDLLRTDPYTDHSMRRPRGYPGDAVLIDMIYSREPGSQPTEFGRSLFDRTMACGASEAVRQRLEFARGWLRDAADEGKTVCSLAGGHMREADVLDDMARSHVTVVDQDEESLNLVSTTYGNSLEAIQGNVFNWLRTAPREGRSYDLVYSLGLTDYLDERQLLVFTRLASKIVAPGGRLILANFHDHRWSAYMEAAMDWHLVYRTEADMAKNADEAGLTSRIFRDETGYIIFCEMKV
jgi:extracellular factor (EF) 3-hydroxypalmitic acid methyl ester biosynthesis protein